MLICCQMYELVKQRHQRFIKSNNDAYLWFDSYNQHNEQVKHKLDVYPAGGSLLKKRCLSRQMTTDD